jgi:hypothetical protein
MGPLLKQSTGAGLLHEVVYLERLKKVRRTIVLCRARNVAHIVELIRQACLFSASNGLLLDTRRIRQGGARNLLPHFSTLDMQVGILHEAAGIVTFRNNELKNPHSKFSLKLKSSVEGVYSKPRTGRGMGLNATARLLGQSNKPRRLPPDGEKKIIQFTNVEDLVRIPARELTEVSSDEVSELLSAEGLSQGCPYCKQPLAGIFFYVRGLHRRPGDEHEDIKGRCQHCYCSTGIDEGMLRDI